MKERFFQILLDLPDTLNNSGLQQSIQILELQNLLFEGIELPQHLHMFFWKWEQIRIGKNLNQSDLKWRKRQRSVEPISALVPLPGNARVTIQECDYDVGFVPIVVGVIFLAHKVAQHGFRDLRIG